MCTYLKITSNLLAKIIKISDKSQLAEISPERVFLRSKNKPSTAPPSSKAKHGPGI